MRRSLTGIFAVLVLIFAAAFCFGQAAPPQSSSAGKGTSSTPGVSSPAPAAARSDADQDDDSPDIPAFARISRKDYLRLRNQHLGLLRGVDDLARNPQARSQGIRRMGVQEQSLRRFGAQSAGVPGPTLPSVPTWTPLGPDPIPNGQTNPTVSVSGRVTAIAVDPNDVAGDTVYVGTAQGGLYRSLDGGATWTPLMDGAQSLAIGAITIDPLDHTKVFVGTGEGSLSLDSFFGVGLYIITSANTTPVVTGPFHAAVQPNPDGFADIFTGRAITQILVNPANDNQILVSTSSGFSGASGDTFNTLPTRGVYLSTNALSGSPAFSRQTIQTSVANRIVTDMAMDPGNANTIAVHVFGAAVAGDGGVWVSTSGNPWAGTATWTQELIDDAGNGSSADNGHFAVNRAGGTPVTTFLLALDQDAPAAPCSGKSGTLWQSTNATTWTELTAARGFCGAQCFYDMPVAVDPTNASNIYIGGSAGSFGACQTGTLSKSTNGGASFAPSQTSLHADSHAIAILPGNPSIMYEGNDGGIFRSTDGGATWTSRNTAGFNATQFESIAVHPSDPDFTIGGTQDNGTPFFQPGGVWTRADFGDGGFAAIDQNAADTTNVTMYHTYFNSSNDLVGFAQVTSVTNASDGGWNFFGCGDGVTPANGITCTDNVLFYAPLALGPGTPNTVYYGTDRLYRSNNSGVVNSAVSQVPIVPGVPLSAIGISPQDDNVRIVGLKDGSVWATITGSSTLTNVTGPWAAKYIARAVIDPNNKFTAYVTLDGYGTANHVWQTINLNAATPTWAAVSTGLPDVPVNAFAVDPASSNRLYAGTDIGVYNSTDGGATWSPYGAGLPRVAVFDLAVTSTAAGHKVRIATHGRGMWETAAVGINDDSTLLVPAPSHISSGNTVTLTATINHGTIVTVPTGTVTFFDGVTALAAPVTVDVGGMATFSTTSLSNGVHNLTAVYSGDSLYRSSVSAPAQVGVGALATATALFAGPANAAVGASVTFTANVDTGASQALPTGTVSFMEGATTLRTVALSGSIVVSFQTSSLSVGTHTVVAVYSGDTSYSASTSSAVVVTLGNSDYAMNFPSGTSTVKAGSPASYTVNITTTNGFGGTINFACPTGLPSLTNCSFNPTSVTVSGNTGSTALSISTTAPTAAPRNPGLSSGLSGAGFLTLGIVLAGLAGRKRRRLQGAFMLIAVLGLVVGFSSCGGGSPPVTHNPGTPPGTYTVTVSATSGSTTHQATITLVVQ